MNLVWNLLQASKKLFDFRTKLIHFLSIYSANEFFSVWQVLPANHSSRLAQYTFTQKIIFDSLLLILQMWRMIITKWLLVGGTPCKMIHSSTIWTRISLRYRGCHLMMTHFTQLMWTKEIPGESKLTSWCWANVKYSKENVCKNPNLLTFSRLIQRNSR